MDQQQFTSEVLDRSHEKPVVVDFWASWCGPCRVLGPVIEELAAEAEGKWELVKVNTEDSQELATAYQIMSIPAVKMFYQGEIIDEFAGALPKHQIVAWLEKNIPNEHKLRLAEIQQNLRAGGDVDTALAQLQALVVEAPTLLPAKLILAQYSVFKNPELALEMVKDIKLGHPAFEQVQDISSLAELASLSEVDLGTGTFAEQMGAAVPAFKAKEWEATLEALVTALMYNKQFQDELPRRATIAMFHLLGEEHELSKKYRPRFSMALY